MSGIDTVPAWAAGRLAFSTLGCSAEPVEQVLELARRTGCHGVELRCAEGEPVAPDTPTATLREIGKQFADAGVEPICVASYVRIAAPDGDPVTDLLHHVEIAEQLGASYVRVFGGRDGQADPHPAAVQRLGEVARRIEGGPVTVLLETHDVFCSARAVAAVLAEVGSPAVAALWDAVNPWRVGESPREAADALAPWLRHVQLKDVHATDDLAPVLPGHGTVPLGQILTELDRLDYRAWLSLEWERAWFPEAPPLDEALGAFRAVLAAHQAAE
ncbi:sugar phosphate isomerase/epimerase family protein [Micromonospora sp. NPDC007271]|uniref:sugar phosphate isomerase/epimerase family protein n=1 Tax=Micromonospora sp. NPDC007271 TaxID=3154587 RepID=UPI0033C909B2